MPYAKSKHIELAKQLKGKKPVPFALYPLTQLAENIRRVLNDDTYINIVDLLGQFGIRKLESSELSCASPENDSETPDDLDLKWVK